MKEEALKAHGEVVKAADEALYDAGFADGQAGAEPTGITQEMVDAKYNEGLAEGEKVGYDKGVASVVIPEGGEYSKAQYDAVQAELAQAKSDLTAAQEADAKTPHTAEEMAAAVSELEATKSELALVKSDDASDKEKIAAGQSKIDAVLAILAPKTPELPVGEVTV